MVICFVTEIAYQVNTDFKHQILLVRGCANFLCYVTIHVSDEEFVPREIIDGRRFLASTISSI